MEKTTDKELRTKIKALINKGANRVDSIKKLQREYKVPFDQIDRTWLQVKSGMKSLTIESTEEERKDLLKSLEKTPVIKRNPTQHINKKVIEEIKAERELKEKIPYSVTEQEIKENQKEYSNLKIIEEIKKVQGQYGTYTKTLNGVKDGRNIFKDTKDIEQYKLILKKETDKQKKDFKAKISELNKQLEEVEEIEQKEFNVLAEIELVFQM